MPITIDSYPHIAEAIINSADASTTLSLRFVSRWFKTLVDKRLYRHLSHAFGTERTSTVSHNLRVIPWTNTSAINCLRVLELQEKDKNDLEPWMTGQRSRMLTDAFRSEPYPLELPKAPNLKYVVVEGTESSTSCGAFLRGNEVSTVVVSLRERDFWVNPTWGRKSAMYHTNIIPKRLWFVTSLGPHAGEYYISYYEETPGHMVYILFPPKGRRTEGGTNGENECDSTDANQKQMAGPLKEEYREEDKESFYSIMLLETQELAFKLCCPDECSDKGRPSRLGDKAFDDEVVPPFSTIVGLETWDVLYPRAKSWQQRFLEDFKSGKLPDHVDVEINQPRFVTLAEWREEITPEEWDIVSGLELD